MQEIRLYRFLRENGGVTVSPKMPEGECDELVRLVADEGKLLAKDGVTAGCVDVENPDGWAEIDDPGYRAEEEEI